MTCPICDSDEDFATDELNGYTYYECGNCGSTWNEIDGFVERVFYEGYEE